MFFLKKWSALLIGVICLIYSGCKTSKNNSTSLEDVIQLSISNVGTTSYNNDKTYLLAVEELTAENEFLKFVVVNISTQKIVLEKKFRPGHVTWFDNNTIELLDTPGIIEENKSMEEYVRFIKIPVNQ